MKTMILATVMALSATFASASGIEGKWRTIDDETKKPKAIVSIVKNGSTYTGTIVGLANGVENVCPACSDKRALIGLTVLTGLKADGDEYTGGRIFDPKSGKTYKSKASVSADGKRLNVRGYIGVSALGRTQTWQRVE